MKKGKSMTVLSQEVQDVLFNDARTYNNWQDKEVADDVIRGVFDLLKMAPTGANCCPARFKFVKSDEAKAALKPHLMEGNVEKTMAAPATVIIAFDLKFYEQLPKLFPHADARSWYVGNEALAKETAMLNGTLQGAYFIMAARTMGLDCGPMAGFDKGGVKDAFFKDEDVAIGFLCNIGYGDPEGLYPRSPRFDFDDVCQIL